MGLVEDLLQTEAYPEPVGAIRFVSTHISYVFLGRTRVYKIKRPVNLGFLDYSTLAARRHFCQEEVRLNRRGAPGVYLGVVPLFRDSRGYSFVRPGETADYAVVMVRLPDEWSAESRLRSGTLSHDDLARVARFLSGYYRNAPETPQFGSVDRLRRNVAENFDQTEPYVGRYVSRELFDRVRAWQEGALREAGPFEQRAKERRIREGHGDLRLEHVYLTPEGVKIIDCVEFLDRFRCGDAARDAAFFSMELRAEGAPIAAEYFLGRFAYETDDYGLYSVVDLYESYLAWVRGKIACSLAEAGREGKRAEAAKLFELARRPTLPRRRPRIVAVGGIIGTGKTTVAEALSRRDGAPVVQADATRKHLAGLPKEEFAGAAPQEGIYTPGFDLRVQEEMLRRAEAVLASGRPVILDATFRSRHFRGRARDLAKKLGASFLFLECRCPEEVARARLRGRTGGVSDAREDLYESFARRFEPPTELPPGEHMILNTTLPLSELLAKVPAHVADRVEPYRNP